MLFTILHTNDLHSNFNNFAKLTTEMKRIALEKENTIILDAGDFADFKSIELQGTNGLAAVELLEYAGYDAITVGNNEMFKRIETLEFMASKSQVPFISCNITNKAKGKVENIKDSMIINKGGINFLLIGTSPNIGEFNELMGFTVEDYKGKIKEQMAINKGKYDICILVNHIGTVADEELSKEVEGVDIIISAHDHVLFDKAKLVGNTIINSAGAYGEHLGYMDCEIVNGKVKLIESGTIQINEETEKEQGVIDILQRNKEKAIEYLSKPLYTIENVMWHDVIEENPITNLIADGLKDMLKCDIGLINSGIVNGGITNKVVTEKKLIDICPSPLNPTSFEIKGKYLKEAINISIDANVCMEDGKGPGYRGKNLGKLHISGGIIKFKNNKVTNILINNKEIEDEKWYTVATSDYLHRGTGYQSLANNQNEVYYPEYIRDVLRVYLNNKDFVEDSFVQRWIEEK